MSSHLTSHRDTPGDMLLEVNCVSGERIGIELMGCTPQEIDFFNKIQVLFKGEEIYKKFGTSSSMT